MAHSNHVSSHEIVTLSVNGRLFTTPLATLQGPAAKGSVLEQIAEQYTRKVVRPKPCLLQTVKASISGGASRASSSTSAAPPNLQNFDLVIMVPGTTFLQCGFGQVLSCLQRMDSGLEIIRPIDISTVKLAAEELGLSRLSELLSEAVCPAPGDLMSMHERYEPCDDHNHQQMMRLLQQMNLQMSTLVNLQQQTLQTLQQQQGATGSLQHQVDIQALYDTR